MKKTELQYKTHRNELVAAVVTKGVRWTGIVVCFYLIYLSVAALAGTSTVADIGVKVLGDLRISEALAWVLGGGGMLYGRRERKLRQNAIKQLGTRNADLERVIDSKRTSSNLTITGQTNPSDDL